MRVNKEWFEYKLGEERENTEDLDKEFLGKKSKLVKIAYTFLGETGVIEERILKTKDCPEDDEEKQEVNHEEN